jgi:hypothetical protein
MTAADTPVFTVIRGRPTTAELAAAIAVLLAMWVSPPSVETSS